MKELKDIIGAYDKVLLDGKLCALATVVHVEGSSYRRPGARMLVTEDGMLTGAISGGCLEGDALRKALLAINERKNKLVTYDTTDEDDAKFGVQLGCNGIVHILFEPIDKSEPNNPVKFLQQALANRESTVLLTIFSLHQKEQIGTCLVNNEKGALTYTKAFEGFYGEMYQSITKNIATCFSTRQSFMKMVIENGVEQSLFFEYLLPPVSLVIIGAGNDALPLVAIAQLLGWDITIIDGRITHATKSRFPQAKNIIITKPENILTQIKINETTVFVLMTHNYNYDYEILKQLFDKHYLYLGILGPKVKMERMYQDAANEGLLVTAIQKQYIYSPVGLDIGAETSEEIALSIVAEIKTVMMGKTAQMLRNKKVGIHS